MRIPKYQESGSKRKRTGDLQDQQRKKYHQDSDSFVARAAANAEVLTDRMAK